MASKGQHQKELIGNLLDDEKCQRNAFATLFTKQDTRHKEITSQVEQIQSELASLTMVEMTKKDLKVQGTAFIFQISRLKKQKMLISQREMMIIFMWSIDALFVFDQFSFHLYEKSTRLNSIWKTIKYTFVFKPFFGFITSSHVYYDLQ